MQERDTARDGVSRRVTIDQPSAPRPRGEATANSEDVAAAAGENTLLSSQIQQIDQGLKAIDRAMAEDAETLLDGAFESVEDVLGHAHADDADGATSDSANDGTEQGVVIAAGSQSNEGSFDPSEAKEAETDAAATATAEAAEDQAEPASTSPAENAAEVASEMLPSREQVVADEMNPNAQHDEPTAESVDRQALSDVPAANEDEKLDDVNEATVSDDATDTADVEQQEDQDPEQPQDQAEVSEQGASHSAVEAEDSQSGDATVAEEVGIDENARVDQGGTEVEPEPSPEATSVKQDVEKSSPKRDRVASTAAKPRPTIKQYAHRLKGRCMEGIAAILTVLSVPLQFLPPSLRSIVDWLALSLIFWVPIVWVLVFLLS